MKSKVYFYAIAVAGCFTACQKDSMSGKKEQTELSTSTHLSGARVGFDGKNYGLRSVEHDIFDTYDQNAEKQVIMVYSADGPINGKTNVKSNANRDGAPLTNGFWDARINYNSDKTVFISNKLMQGATNAGLGLMGNDIPVGDTIIFASVYNGKIDYSRSGKLNGYYNKMQYYYNSDGRLSRIVNWTNHRFGGGPTYRVLDFRFTYDSYGNLLSWNDVSPYHVGGVTYTYNYSIPISNAYYDETRNFVEPPFTIMQQFGLLPDLNPKHLRTSAHITSQYYPEDMTINYSDQVYDAAGNLLSYAIAPGNRYVLTWSSF